MPPTEIENPAFRKSLLAMLPHVALGMGGAQVENNTLLDDASDNVKHINLGLGAITGGIGGSGRGFSNWGKALAALPPKEMALLGLKDYDKDIGMRMPIADKQLQTATIANDTARIQGEAAKHWGPKELGTLGLAGAGIAGAGGLGYYLWKTLGPGKKKPSPKVTVHMPLRKGRGDVDVEGDLDTLNLSERLYKSLKRDTKHQLRQSVVEQEPDLMKAAAFPVHLEPLSDADLILKLLSLS